MATVIEITDIKKSYGQLTVLKGINLSIEKGQITSIVGPSGAGKTTLLQIMGTLDRPDNGRVTYDGIEVTRLSDRRLSLFRNQNIGFVFQFHNLLPEFNALENVMLPALIGGASRRKATQDAMKLLEVLGLSDRATHKPSALSGGEKQRVAVARALINNPAIVFADEPTGSLDSVNREEIQRLFTSLRDDFGHTFVIVTHDHSLAEIADRIITIDDGLVLSDENTPQTLLVSQ